jgi:hypothetical protein
MFAALGNQHELRLRNIVIWGLSGNTLFFYINKKKKNFKKKKKKDIEYEIRVLIFSTSLSGTYRIVRRTERDMIQNMHWFSCTVAFLPGRF